MDGASVRAGRDRSSNDAAWMVMGNLIAGMAIYGGLGWLLGHWLGHQQVLTAVGFVFGLAAGLYLVYVRLGLSDKPVRSPVEQGPVRTKDTLAAAATKGVDERARR